MNQETEKNINEAINWLQETGASVQDFAIEQAPLYCREVVAWELWSGVAGIAGATALIGATLYLANRLKRWISKEIEECNPAAAFLVVGLAVTIAFGAFSLCAFSSSAIKAAVAPRMVIVEHLRGLKNP